jgi:sugar/nucleoside kinase (ribokinase family)
MALIAFASLERQRMIKKGIAVIGSTTVDKIVAKNSSFFKIGGVTTYSGITYARHGIKTFAVTNIAPLDSELSNRLQKQNVIVCHGQTEYTTHFENTIDGDNRRQRIPLKARKIGSLQISNVLKHVRSVHLGPLHPSDIDIKAIKLLTAPDLFVIVDAQGYVRSVKNEIVYPHVSKKLTNVLKASQIVKVNASEYDKICNYYQMHAAELVKRFKIEEFIVTLGKKGGFVKTGLGDCIHYDPVEVKTIEDPTGAGDIFLAAYVIARFSNTKDISNACKYAAKLVSQHIEGDYITGENLGLKNY